MDYFVVRNVTVQTKQGLIDYHEGATVQLKKADADRLNRKASQPFLKPAKEEKDKKEGE